jgi:hypothetical protein
MPRQIKAELGYSAARRRFGGLSLPQCMVPAVVLLRATERPQARGIRRRATVVLSGSPCPRLV